MWQGNIGREIIATMSNDELQEMENMTQRMLVVAQVNFASFTAQKMKFFNKDFFSKYDQIPRKVRIWSHLLKKSLMENFIFGQCFVVAHYLKKICME